MVLESVASILETHWNSIIVSVIVIGGTVVVHFIIKRLLARIVDSTGIAANQARSLYSISKISIIIIAAVLITFQFSTTTGVIASAITLSAGTIIGFASINTIGNAVAGILLLSSRPFKVGDRIRVSDDDRLLGDVVEITLLYTKIKTVRSELVSIPNQILLQQRIINYSGFEIVAVSVEISMGYDSDRKRIESLLLESVKKTSGILDDPKPYVLLTKFDNFALVYELRAYIDKPNQHITLQSEISRNVYDIFQANSLDLTTPIVLRKLGAEDEKSF